MDCLKVAWQWIKKAAKAFHEGMKSFELDFFPPPPRYKNPFEHKIKKTREQLQAWALADFAVTLVKLRLADEEKDQTLLCGSHKYMLFRLARQAGLKDYEL